MGEAKRRLEEMKVAPCRCRSGRQSASCCFDGVRWHKPASGLDLRSGSPSTTLERCYMQELGNCEAPISGEHLISEAVIEILRGDGNFTASGLPWLEAGDIGGKAPEKGAETTGREVRIAVRLVDRGERVPRPGPAPAAARLPPHGAHQQFRPPRTTPRSSEASRAAATRCSF